MGRTRTGGVLAVALVCYVATAVLQHVAAEPISLRGFGKFAVDRVSSGNAPGIRGSWSQKGIDYAREVAVAIIEKSVSSMHIPDISFDKGTRLFPQRAGAARPDVACSVRQLARATRIYTMLDGLMCAHVDAMHVCGCTGAGARRVGPQTPSPVRCPTSCATT